MPARACGTTLVSGGWLAYNLSIQRASEPMNSEPRATHLVLVRHGQSLYNRDGASAPVDSGLTELGWKQSQLVADWLARAYKADVLISSPLLRAQQTADIISQRVGLAVLTQSGLEEAEQSYWQELPSAAESAPFALWDSPWLPTPATAPNYSAFRDRVRQALAEILARHWGKRMIIVTHGGTIGTIVRSLFGGHAMPVVTENSGVTHLGWQEGRWELIVHNSQCHLGPMTSSQGSAQVLDTRPLSPWARERHLQAVLDRYDRSAHAYPLKPSPQEERQLQALARLAAPAQDAVVIDMACGAGAVALAFAPYVAWVTGVDISPAMLERAEQARLAIGARNVRFRWGDATALPFPDRTADLITCRDLWQHCSDPGLFLKEASRVAKPSGRLLLDGAVGSDDPIKRVTHEAIEVHLDPSFLKLYTLQEIQKLLSRSGMRIEKQEPYEVFLETEDWLSQAASDEGTRAVVRSMLEASLEGDAAGLHLRRSRDGTLSFVQQRLRLLAAPRSPAET